MHFESRHAYDSNILTAMEVSTMDSARYYFAGLFERYGMKPKILSTRQNNVVFSLRTNKKIMDLKVDFSSSNPRRARRLSIHCNTYKRNKDYTLTALAPDFNRCLDCFTPDQFKLYLEEIQPAILNHFESAKSLQPLMDTI